MLWVEGHMSSYFLLVKMSIPTRFTCGTRRHHSEDDLPHATGVSVGAGVTLACPCLPVFEVDISTILQGCPFSNT